MQHQSIEARVVSLTQELIRASTPAGDDNGAQQLLMPRLKAIGFENLVVPSLGCNNLLSIRGSGARTFAFAGHTDVVPPGDGWSLDPFAGSIVNDAIVGRGVADMKGAVAAFVIALEDFLSSNPDAKLPIVLLIAGDEETRSKGTPDMLQTLADQGIQIEWCLVGEPSSTDQVGDCVRVGRRGSVGGNVKFLGVQGHVAYSHLVKNPIHASARFITKLTDLDFDRAIPPEVPSDRNDGWPQTEFQTTNNLGRSGALNVVPSEADLDFDIRFRPPHTRESLKETIEVILREIDFPYEIKWRNGFIPYDSKPGVLLESVTESIKAARGILPRLSRGGGTSDGRFVAAAGAEVVECGPSNATIHKKDESLPVSQLVEMVGVYTEILASMNRVVK
jgi:succinyl-diaminopimelate desuccinylase